MLHPRAPLLPGWRPARRLAIGLLAAIVAVGAAAPPRPEAASALAAGDEEFDEYVVKAAFLYNLIGYTTWPAEAFEDKDSPIRLVVLGKDPFGDKLDTAFRGKRLHGRAIVVERSRTVPEDVQGHVVFCALDSEVRETVLRRTAGRPVLVIGESPGFAEDGATVNLRLEERKLRFEVNTDALKASKLALSSQVLKLAKLVKTRKKK